MPQDAPTEPDPIITKHPHPPKPNPPGSGILHLTTSTKAQFSTLLATYPLKLLSPTPLPSQPPNLALCYTLAYGGGLVAGDLISLKIDIDPRSALVLLTQGSTKIFKYRPGLRPQSSASPPSPPFPLYRPIIENSKPEDGGTKQRLHVSLQPHSLLLLLPDSISPFRGSKYIQIQRFILPSCGTASLLVLDWVNSGRGERPLSRSTTTNLQLREYEVWSMKNYTSINEIIKGSKLIIRERMVLENPTCSISPEVPVLSPVAKRLDPYNVYSTLLIIGPQFISLLKYLDDLADKTTQFQIPRPPLIAWSFSSVENGTGGILRVAGGEVEDVRKWLREVLEGGGVKQIVGDGLWSRII